MKKLLFIIIIVFSAITAGAQEVLPQTWADSLADRVDSIVQKEYTKTVVSYQKVRVRRGRHRRRRTVTVRHEKTVDVKFAIGCSVYDLTDDSLLYSFNGDAFFKPASTQKLFTGITALDKLGYNYKFRTTVYQQGKIREDSLGRKYLDGNICISGCYDPTLKRDNMESIAHRIEALNIDSIGGYIFATGFNSTQKNVLTPIYNYLKRDSMLFSCEKPTIESNMFLEGKDTMQVLMNMNTPFESVLDPMMKRSKNDYAEAMLHNVSDPHNHEWSYEACKYEVIKMIGRADGDSDDFKIYDGSGLSHSNRCTPELQTDILRYAYRRHKVFPYLYRSLPIAGVDGTLSSRMHGTLAEDNVHAKTGTINGVSTLAGYAYASNGHLLAFSIMVNDISSKNLARSVQDDICIELTK